ncbi:MAG: GHKL domain-containing protein [Eubacteriales bacterium]|nr:GHKL domain-containing protein [Eubacteriales bacterium]
MKRLLKLILALLLSGLLCVPAVFAVFYYTQPMEDVSHELFRLVDDGEEYWDGGDGWVVYTEEAGKRTELVSNGMGGYTGLSYSGQTFYYSKELTEESDSPMLKIGAVNRTVSVFLDGEMIYTDCPELDNRIGYLTLPMLEYDRMEPVTVSLSPDYQGKTLTIAQSTGVSETQPDDETVWPCDVTLYCGYAYESGLIASSAKTMIPAVLLFSLLLLLIAVFIWNASQGIFSPKPIIFALAVLFQMCSVLAKADFFFQYFGTLPIDLTDLFFYFSVGAFLLFLTLHASRLRLLFAGATLLQWISVLLSFFIQTEKLLEYGDLYVFFMYLPQITGFLTLAAALIGAFLLWKRGIPFFRHMAQTALILIIGYLLFLAVSIPVLPGYAASVFTRLAQGVIMLVPKFALTLLWNLCLLSGLAAVLFDFIEQLSRRRTELAVLSSKNRLALESYENLRLQSEEIMMLRHDTVRHYTLLQAMAKDNPEQISGYLEELIGQTKQIRPVIACRNQTLNILLNGKLNIAKAKGIKTEIDRCDAPEKLPLSDPELCSLILNILDNAINAASVSQKPYILLDFHCKAQHFVFSCKNSVPDKASDNKKTPTPEHGYGLKIIRQIMKRFGDNMLSVEQTKNAYRITVVIPL